MKADLQLTAWLDPSFEPGERTRRTPTAEHRGHEHETDHDARA